MAGDKPRIHFVTVTDAAGNYLGAAEAWLDGQTVRFRWESEYRGPVQIHFGTMRDETGQITGLYPPAGY